MKDLKPGMILKGTVRNVIDFGAFVDIGVHQDGLVHISQMTDRYIKHPLEAVSVGDIVEVKVLERGSAEKEDRIDHEVRQIVHSYMYIMSKNELRSSGEHRRCGFANGASEL